MGKLSIFWSGLKRSLRIIARNKVGLAGLIVFLLIIIMAYVAPVFLKPDLTAHLDKIYQKPSAAHWFGTDNQGRDIFQQIMIGGQSVISVAALTALCTVAVGTALGALSGILGGWVETVSNALAELTMTIPHFPLLLVIAAFFRLESGAGLALIIASISWGQLFRAIQAQVLTLKERDYVQAARALGLPTFHLLFKEILPNMMSYITVQFIMSMTNAIYYMIVLVFLGITPMKQQDWGVMFTMAQRMGAIYNPNSRMFLFAPVGAIVLLQVSLIAMSRSLDELFNPRLRAGE